VIVIDLVLAGDNALVVGMAAAALPYETRRKAIVIGIAAAALLRIFFAVFTTQLLNVIGLVLAGGLLLLWVAWKLFRETRRSIAEAQLAASGGHEFGLLTEGEVHAPVSRPALPRKTLPAALTQIVVADVSMSLDNVLAVAGTARHHLPVLVIGLALSVGLMGIAATLIAGVLRRYPWISYLGLLLIAWVAIAMISEGSWQILGAAGAAPHF
jgi:YjbE family integral membrane protein